MNKYQKAIKKFNQIIDNEAYSIEFQEFCELAVETLEKATPKKVTHEAAKRTSCTCPNCLNVIDLFEAKVRVKYDYCKICGQALDWSEE